MIEVKLVDGSLIMAEATDELEAEQFGPLAAQVDNQIALFGTVSLLLDLRHLAEWGDFGAAQAGLSFIDERRDKFQRLAVVVDERLRTRVTALADVLIDGEMKVFDAGSAEEAERWVAEGTRRMDDLAGRNTAGAVGTAHRL